MIRSYKELSQLKTFEDRYRYLQLTGRVGEETFGRSRFMNQSLYHSDEWSRIRDQVIIRDNGCDLGIEGWEIRGHLIVHHMNPITEDDIRNRLKYVLDPEYLICTSITTHNGIHYGDETFLVTSRPAERREGDTCPWKKVF